MVRIFLDMCVPDLKSPTDIYAAGEKERLLLKAGTSLTEKTKHLLGQNGVEYIEFPLPFETADPPPFTFSEEIESALFRLVRTTFLAFKENAVEKPHEIRKQAYDIIAQAWEEFQAVSRLERPMDDSPPSRDPRSVVHLRTIGAVQDYLFEHAKNVCLTCVVLGFDYFQEPSQLLADLHKVAVAALFADIGMMKIPARIITKATELTDEEWGKIRKHPEMSARFVESIFRQKDFITTRVVLQHHERGHGAGYPSKLFMSQMEPYARLFAVVDSYHSMISKRYFRPAINPVDAVLRLNAQAPKVLEERAVRALNYRVAPYPVGSVARLADGQMVLVLALTPPPVDFAQVRLLPGASKRPEHNTPEKVRPFAAEPAPESPPEISVVDRLDEMGEPVDTFDLLSLYGYVEKI